MSKSRTDDKDSKAEREARRAAALRANLQRRKEQSRARAETLPDAQPDRPDGQKGQE